MSEADRLRWDAIHASDGPVPAGGVAVPDSFSPLAGMFPRTGTALDLACGAGRGAVWLALRGLEVHGVDVSPVAVGRARELAALWRVGDRCRFTVHDLDLGVPPGGAADVILCNRFRAPDLYAAIAGRLAPGGLLAIAVLSEVGSGPGPYRAAPAELVDAFADLAVVAAGEGAGAAWLIARKPATTAGEPVAGDIIQS